MRAPQYHVDVPTKISSGYKIAPPMHVRQLTERPRPAQNEFAGVMFPATRMLKPGARMTAARLGETSPTTHAMPARILRPNCAIHTKHTLPPLITPTAFSAKKI